MDGPVPPRYDGWPSISSRGMTIGPGPAADLSGVCHYDRWPGSPLGMMGGPVLRLGMMDGPVLALNFIAWDDHRPRTCRRPDWGLSLRSVARFSSRYDGWPRSPSRYDGWPGSPSRYDGWPRSPVLRSTLRAQADRSGRPILRSPPYDGWPRSSV